MSIENNLDDLVKTLTTQITEQASGTISNIVTQQVRQMVSEVIGTRLKTLDITDMVRDHVTRHLETNTQQASLTNVIRELSDRVLADSADTIIKSVTDSVRKMVTEQTAVRIKQVDIAGMVREYVINYLNNGAQKTLFPDNSIPGTSIDIKTLRITGDQMSGGIVRNFGSTGIEDKSTTCQVTVMDRGTVFENTLFAPRLEIRGDAVIDGRLVINGGMDEDGLIFTSVVKQAAQRVRDAIGPELLDSYQNRVYENILSQGINISSLMIDGQPVIQDRALTTQVVHSHLQTVGQLHDLQTRGETLLSETLYVSGRRVGINTMDPAAALSIWDEEVEIDFGKQQQDMARISTRRDQQLVLGTNRNNNITLHADGTTEIDRLRLGGITISSAESAPNYDAPKGTVLFNENPTLGGPLGWVSLGSSRWANFGIID